MEIKLYFASNSTNASIYFVAMPTTSACYDTQVCTDDISNCYQELYKSQCCRTCQDAYNPDALFGCEYGDRATYCSLITKEQCENIVSLNSSLKCYVFK